MVWSGTQNLGVLSIVHNSSEYRAPLLFPSEFKSSTGHIHNQFAKTRQWPVQRCSLCWQWMGRQNVRNSSSACPYSKLGDWYDIKKGWSLLPPTYWLNVRTHSSRTPRLVASSSSVERCLQQRCLNQILPFKYLLCITRYLSTKHSSVCHIQSFDLCKNVK